MRFTSSAALAGLLATTAASVIPRASNDACGQIYQKYGGSTNGTASGHKFHIPGEIALECLKAMPFEAARATKLVTEWGKWLQFQSDLEILKNPPANYQMPSIDIVGALSDIQAKIDGKKYKNHYEFDTDIQNLIFDTYDGHVALGVCSYSAYQFESDLTLVSVSTNGTELPQVYEVFDAKHAKTGVDSVSPIVSINGQKVEDYLTPISKQGQSQDWDALYNSVFFTNPSSLAGNGVSGEFLGKFQASNVFTSAYYAVHFANGTTKVFDTYVKIGGWPFKSGKELYQAICLPTATGASGSSSSSTPTPTSTPSTSSTPTSLAPVVGYPKPAYQGNTNAFLGFFPTSKGLEDTAVLAIPTFSLEGEEDLIQFVNSTQEFIIKAAKKGKKKMIVDLQGNNGGVIALGQILFKYFFPKEPIYSATRFRAHEGIDFIGEALQRLPEDGPEEGSIFGWKSNVKPDQKEGFKSWKDQFGPEEVLGVTSSKLFATNMTELLDGFDSDIIESLFAPEDIILLTDGLCASTCTIFSELMKNQGVRSIAFGGRPQNGPMQAIGGVKGAQVQEFSEVTEILAAKKQALKSENSTKPLLSEEELEQWDKYVPIPLSEFPYMVYSGSVNLLNAFGPKNNRIPRQFIYEAAECRRFYTIDNVLNQETTWASAADAMFHGGGCVPGSENGPGSLNATNSKSQRLLAAMLEYTHSS